MKKIAIQLLIIILTFGFGSCSDYDLQSFELKGRLTSEVTGAPITNVPIVAFTQGYRGAGLFSGTYEVDRNLAITDSEGNFSMLLNYETDKFNSAFIFKDAGNICTEFLNTKKSYEITEIDGVPLNIEARKLYPIEVAVKNVDPFDQNDSIYLHLIETDPNNVYQSLFEPENFGVENQPRNPDQVGVVDNLYWVGENVNSILRSSVQEDAEIVFHYSVMKNGVLTSYTSEPIPTVENGTTYYEINY